MGGVKTRLSIMMILQYAVWGVWLPTLSTYLRASTDQGGLGFSDAQIGMIVGLAGSVGAITAPFIAGQLADRYFSTERFLSALIFLGGIVMFLMASQKSFGAWLALSIVYSVLYMPTLSLTNSIAFANLKDVNLDWPRVRVMGTFGWIGVGWLFSWFVMQQDLKFTMIPPFLSGTQVPDATARIVETLRVSGGISMFYAAYCLLLPHTPPKRGNVESLAFAKAFQLFRHSSFAILVIASLPISVIHNIYFAQTGPFFTNQLGLRGADVAPAMTVGQIGEIGVMFFLGLIIAKLGFRWTIALGGMGYILRYAIWGLIGAGEPAAVAASGELVWTVPMAIGVISQALHGLCYSCFFATAYIYTERIAEADIRNSAQTVFGIMILGIGPVMAAPALKLLASLFGDGNVITNFSGMWFALSGVALLTTLVFAAVFRDQTADKRGPTGPEALTEEVMGPG